MVEDCGVSLKKWNKEVYSVSQNRLSLLMKRLKRVRKMSPTTTVIEEHR